MGATKIEKIVVDIHGQRLELTLEQARELRDILDTLRGKDTYIPYPVHPPVHPRRYWDLGPIWTSRGIATPVTTYGISCKV